MFKFSTTLVIFFLLKTANLFGQEEQLFIKYDFYFKQHTGSFKINTLSNNGSSLQTVIRNFNLVSSKGVVENLTQENHIYKDYKQKTVLYKEYITPNFQLVIDSLNIMKWKLTGKSKQILTYICYEASSTYRGRDYIAYFTKEIPFKVAPWKFHGLPGVMLEINSIDEEVKIAALEIKIGYNLGNIQNPFFGENILAWEGFLKKYFISQQKFEEFLKKTEILTGKESISRSVGRIDLISQSDFEIYQNERK